MSKADATRTLKMYAQRLSSSASVVTLTILESTADMSRLFDHFACNMRRIGVVPLVWSLSLRTHRAVAQKHVASIYAESLALQFSNEGDGSNSPGSKKYMNVVQLKPHVLLRVLELGYDVLYFDIDLGFKADPRPWLFQEHAGKADMQIALNTCFDNLLNTGIVYIRHNERSIAVVKEWAQQAHMGECKA